MRVSRLFGPAVKRRKEFADVASYSTSRLFGELSFLSRPERGGLDRFDPLVRLERRLETAFVAAFDSPDLARVEIPVLQDPATWRRSERWSTFEADVFTTEDGRVLCPTTEEPLTRLLGLDAHLSYRELPRVAYGRRTLFRRTPSNSYRRPPEFHLLDLYSFHRDESALRAFVAETVEPAFASVFDRFGLDVRPVPKREGYTDYKYLTGEGDDTAFLAADGTAYHDPADADAETTPASCLSLGVTMELGDRYPAAFGVDYVDADGETRTPVVGNYGIGLERLAYAVVDANRRTVGGYHTVDWPDGLHPYEFGIVGVPASSYPGALYADLDRPDVLYDDTDDPVGTKVARMYALGVKRFAVVGDDERGDEALRAERTADGQIESAFINSLAR